MRRQKKNPSALWVKLAAIDRRKMAQEIAAQDAEAAVERQQLEQAHLQSYDGEPAADGAGDGQGDKAAPAPGQSSWHDTMAPDRRGMWREPPEK